MPCCTFRGPVYPSEPFGYLGLGQGGQLFGHLPPGQVAVTVAAAAPAAVVVVIRLDTGLVTVIPAAAHAAAFTGFAQAAILNNPNGSI